MMDFLGGEATSSDGGGATSTVTVVPTGEGVSAGMEREGEGGMSAKMKIGVGVGVAIGGLVVGLVGMGVGYFWGRRGGMRRGQNVAGGAGDGRGSVRLEKPKGVIGGTSSAGSAGSTSPCLEVVKCG